MASNMENTEETGKLHQMASACQRSRIEKAKGTRISHRETANMMSGGTTAPVARTTPYSTIEVPKNRNDQMTMELRCTDTASAAPSAGKNRLRTCRLNTESMMINVPPNRKLNSTPVTAT